MSFSSFQISHALTSFEADIGRRAIRRAVARSRFRLPLDRELTRVDLIPGFVAPFGYLPALPVDGIKSDDGVVLGGFAAEPVANERLRCSEAEWSERLGLINERCSKILTGKGRGRNPVLEDRESTCEQNHGNVRFDVTFGLRRGSQFGLDPTAVLELMAQAVKPALEAAFSGVRVAGIVIHPPNPFVNAAERGEEGDVEGFRASGMNLHPQVYTYRAFSGEWTSASHKGFSHVEEFVVAGLQHDQLGVDVHRYGRVREGVRLEWLYRCAAEEDLAKIAEDNPGAEKRVRSVRERIHAGKTTMDDQIAAGLKRWDARWEKSGTKSTTLLDVYRRNLATAEASQGHAINWWLSVWATRFLLNELPKHDPRWSEHLNWGRGAAEAVLDAHVQTRFQVPLLELLERFEHEDLIRSVNQVRNERKEAALMQSQEQMRAASANKRVQALERAKATQALQAQALRKLETLEDAVEILEGGGKLSRRQRTWFSPSVNGKMVWGPATLETAIGPVPTPDILARVTALKCRYEAYLNAPAKSSSELGLAEPVNSRISQDESTLLLLEQICVDPSPECSPEPASDAPTPEDTPAR